MADGEEGGLLVGVLGGADVGWQKAEWGSPKKKVVYTTGEGIVWLLGQMVGCPWRGQGVLLATV